MKSPITYAPEFLCHDLSITVLEALLLDLDWERRDSAPRSEYWTNIFRQSYTYGRGAGERTYYPRVTHPAIEAVTDLLEQRLGFRYEGCFLNRYDNEREALGWHSDDDPYINHTRPIAVVTLGQAREIQLKAKDAKPKPVQVGNVEMMTLAQFQPPVIVKQMLEPGSLLLMEAGVQDTHVHRIPKAPSAVGTRISLTYRSLIKREDA